MSKNQCIFFKQIDYKIEILSNSHSSTFTKQSWVPIYRKTISLQYRRIDSDVCVWSTTKDLMMKNPYEMKSKLKYIYNFYYCSHYPLWKWKPRRENFLFYVSNFQPWKKLIYIIKVKNKKYTSNAPFICKIGKSFGFVFIAGLELEWGLWLQNWGQTWTSVRCEMGVFWSECYEAFAALCSLNVVSK